MATDHTLASFVKTRRFTTDLGDAINDDSFTGDNGYVYDTMLFIIATKDYDERLVSRGRWTLMADGLEWQSDDLTSLEALLFWFGINEGNFQLKGRQ